MAKPTQMVSRPGALAGMGISSPVCRKKSVLKFLHLRAVFMTVDYFNNTLLLTAQDHTRRSTSWLAVQPITSKSSAIHIGETRAFSTFKYSRVSDGCLANTRRAIGNFGACKTSRRLNAET